MYDYEGVLIAIKVKLSKDYNNNKQFTIICWSVRAIIAGHPLVIKLHVIGQFLSETVLAERAKRWMMKWRRDAIVHHKSYVSYESKRCRAKPGLGDVLVLHACCGVLSDSCRRQKRPCRRRASMVTWSSVCAVKILALVGVQFFRHSSVYCCCGGIGGGSCVCRSYHGWNVVDRDGCCGILS